MRLQSNVKWEREGICHVISSALCSGETFDLPLSFLPFKPKAPMFSNDKTGEILVYPPFSCPPSHPPECSTVFGWVCMHNPNKFALQPLLVMVCFRGALPGHLLDQQIVSFLFFFGSHFNSVFQPIHVSVTVDKEYQLWKPFPGMYATQNIWSVQTRWVFYFTATLMLTLYSLWWRKTLASKSPSLMSLFHSFHSLRTSTLHHSKTGIYSCKQSNLGLSQSFPSILSSGPGAARHFGWHSLPLTLLFQVADGPCGIRIYWKGGGCCSGPRGQKSCGNLSRCSSYCIRVIPVVTTTS